MNAPRLSGCPHPRPVTASTCPVGPSPDPRGHDPPPGASLLRAGLSRCRGELTLPLQRSFTSLHPSLPPPHLLGPAPLTPSCHRGLVAVLLLTPPFSTHLAKSPTIAGHMPQVTERLALPLHPPQDWPTLLPSASSQMTRCGLYPTGLATRLTSLLRPTSHAAAVEATAAATAAARPRLGSVGSCKKSGAATGCTSSEGKRPTRPWMVPSRQPRGRGGV